MQFQFRGLLFLLLAPLATLPAESSSDAQALTLEAAVEQALLQAPQLVAQVASQDAAQALTVSAGRLPDPQFVVGLDNLPVTGADAYSTTRDFMTMRRVGVMQEFPAAQKRRLRRDLAEAQSSLAGAELTEVRLAIAQFGRPGSDAAPPPPLSQACRHSSRIWSCRPLRPRRQSLPGVARPPRRSPRRPPLSSLRIGSSGCRARSDALCSSSSAGSVRMRCDRSGRCPRSTAAGPRGGVAGLRARAWRPAALRCARRRGAAGRRASKADRRPTGARNWPMPNVAPTFPTWFPSRFASACRCSRDMARIRSSQRKARSCDASRRIGSPRCVCTRPNCTRRSPSGTCWGGRSSSTKGSSCRSRVSGRAPRSLPIVRGRPTCGSRLMLFSKRSNR